VDPQHQTLPFYSSAPRKTQAEGRKLADRVRIRRPRVYRQLVTGALNFVRDALVDEVRLGGFPNFAGDSENLARHQQPRLMVSVDILCVELPRRGHYTYLISINASKAIFPGDTKN